MLQLGISAYIQNLLREIVSELVHHELLKNCNQVLDQYFVEFDLLDIIESLLKHSTASLVVGVEVVVAKDLIVLLTQLGQETQLLVLTLTRVLVLVLSATNSVSQAKLFSVFANHSLILEWRKHLNVLHSLHLMGVLITQKVHCALENFLVDRRVA